LDASPFGYRSLPSPILYFILCKILPAFQIWAPISPRTSRTRDIQVLAWPADRKLRGKGEAAEGEVTWHLTNELPSSSSVVTALADR